MMNNKRITDPVLTLTYGAVDAYPAVTRALSRPILFDYDPVFLALYEEVTEKARIAMRLSKQPVILQGAPTLGVEAAAALSTFFTEKLPSSAPAVTGIKT